MTEKRSPYTCLGISPDATIAEIRCKYKKLAVLHHPDKNGSTRAATIRFQQILRAYETLIGPDTRSRYDEQDASSGSNSNTNDDWRKPQRHQPYWNFGRHNHDPDADCYTESYASSDSESSRSGPPPRRHPFHHSLQPTLTARLIIQSHLATLHHFLTQILIPHLHKAPPHLKHLAYCLEELTYILNTFSSTNPKFAKRKQKRQERKHNVFKREHLSKLTDLSWLLVWQEKALAKLAAKLGNLGEDFEVLRQVWDNEENRSLLWRAIMGLRAVFGPLVKGSCTLKKRRVRGLELGAEAWGGEDDHNAGPETDQDQ